MPDTEPFRVDDFDCPVVKHRVVITGEKVYLYGQGQYPIAIRFRFGQCSGMTECKIFARPFPAAQKPTGCPYYDVTCG